MKHTWNTIATLLIVALVIGLAADGSATTATTMSKNNKLVINKANSGTFSVTGRYLGSLEGRIFVGTRPVQVPKSTPVYVVGQGLQKDRYFVNNGVVYISGVRKNGKEVATMIIVRPSISGSITGPQDAGSKVGEYADDVPN